jgi:hypothetical protein
LEGDAGVGEVVVGEGFGVVAVIADAEVANTVVGAVVGVDVVVGGDEVGLAEAGRILKAGELNTSPFTSLPLGSTP